MSQGKVEQPIEDPGQLVRAGFNHSPWDDVVDGSSPRIHHSQCPPDLMFLEVEGAMSLVKVKGMLVQGLWARAFVLWISKR